MTEALAALLVAVGRIATTHLLLPEPRPDVTGATADIFERRIDAAFRARTSVGPARR